MSNNYDDQQQYNNEQDLQQQVDPNAAQQQSYDDYYGGTSMEYSASQIENYEQGYDANAYADYYAQYLQTPAQQAAYDEQVHKEQYEYYKEHKEELRTIFPKKKKIVRWEDMGESYNSLEAADEFMDILSQMQEAQAAEQEARSSKNNEFDDIE